MFTLQCYNEFVSWKKLANRKWWNMKKLEELIFDQNNLVKYMNNSKTREERFFYKREIDVIEEHINNLRRQLNLD